MRAVRSAAPAAQGGAVPRHRSEASAAAASAAAAVLAHTTASAAVAAITGAAAAVGLTDGRRSRNIHGQNARPPGSWKARVGRADDAATPAAPPPPSITRVPTPPYGPCPDDIREAGLADLWEEMGLGEDPATREAERERAEAPERLRVYREAMEDSVWENSPWLDIVWLEGGSGYEYRLQDGLECEQLSKLALAGA